MAKHSSYRAEDMQQLESLLYVVAGAAEYKAASVIVTTGVQSLYVVVMRPIVVQFSLYKSMKCKKTP